MTSSTGADTDLREQIKALKDEADKYDAPECLDCHCGYDAYSKVLALIDADRKARAERQFKVVTLVGSVKQVEDWRFWTDKLTRAGYIVFEAGVYGTLNQDVSTEVWDQTTHIHFAKISMSDYVGIIPKPDGSIGEHTKADIEFAKSKNVKVVTVAELSQGAESQLGTQGKSGEGEVSGAKATQSGGGIRTVDGMLTNMDTNGQESFP